MYQEFRDKSTPQLVREAGTGEGNTEGRPGACGPPAEEIREGFLEKEAPELSPEGQNLINLTPPSPRANTR